jgi:hypothetical protein
MSEGFLGNDFDRRLQETLNSSSSGISLGVEYKKKGNNLSGDERKGCKLMFLLPTSG